MGYPRNTVLIAGGARSSDANPITVAYENIIIVLVVEKGSGIIIDAEMNFICSITNNFLKEILVGKNINTGLEEIVEELNARYLGASRKAIITCLKDARNKLVVNNQINI